MVPLLAVDTETEGVAWNDPAFLVTCAWREGEELVSFKYELDDPMDVRFLKDRLHHSVAWVGHNLKFDLQKLALAGIIDGRHIGERQMHDTAVMYHLLNENDRKALKYLAVKILGEEDVIEVEIKSGPNKGQMKRVPREDHEMAEARRKLKLKKEDGYHLLPREVVIPYALKDAEFTLRLYERFDKALSDQGLHDVYLEEMQSVMALYRMEADGLRLDMEYLPKATSDYGVLCMKLEGVLHALGGGDLNPNSHDQVLKVLHSRGLRVESTGVEVLATLDDEFAHTLLKYREAKKLHGTYLKALLAEQRDGVVHPNFNPTGARTGRLSSSTSGG
jgi:DNA polymerase I-like protein with 3'-5' exonuclease and polymerase domains